MSGVPSHEPLEIRPDDLSGPEIRALLAEHLRNMFEVTPPESVHALDLEGLLRPEVSVWSAWRGGRLLGCGALQELEPDHGEIKSMRTATEARGQGIGRAMVEHFLAEARRRGYRRLSLETGTAEAFAPARRLYASCGFTPCGPFARYLDDPRSVFFTLAL